jgi:hypothetical protein
VFCSNRGTRNEEGTSYCVNCGAELRKIHTPSVRSEHIRPQHPQLPPASRLADPSLVLSSFAPPFVTVLGAITGIVAIVYGAQVNGKVAGVTTLVPGIHRARPGCGPGSRRHDGPGVAHPGGLLVSCLSSYWLREAPPPSRTAPVGSRMPSGGALGVTFAVSLGS